MSVDRRTLRTQRASGDGCSVVASAESLDAVEHGSQLLSDGRKVGDPADRAAVGINGDLIELAERTLQSGQGLLNFSDAGIGHAEIENHRRRERERITGKKLQGLLSAIFEHGEILGTQA